MRFGRALHEHRVTTAIDAGSSGPINFKGFQKLVYEPSKTRMIAFVALAQHGVLNDPGELEDLRFADPNSAAATVGESPTSASASRFACTKKAWARRK